MIKFKEYLNEVFITEMPHIIVGEKAVDLELEIHSTMSEKDFYQFIKDWFDGKKIQSKNKNILFSIPEERRKEFSKKLLSNLFFKTFIINNFNVVFWNKIETYLRGI